ncbi:MAG: hypothetical protein K5912_00645 [Alphaproteobacteria bacterium]|nr:hypothetical protein [Alphaproteobacteria bacterium]
MKKTLLSAIACLAVIGSAAAIPTPESARENCRYYEQQGTHIWLDVYGACIPKNACKDGNDDTQRRFCDRTFADIQVAEEGQALALASKYMTQSFPDEKSNCTVLETTIVGQDYIRCTTQTARYFILEFDDISDRGTRTTVPSDGIAGTCLAYLHKPVEWSQISTNCTGADRAECEEIAHFASTLLGSPTVRASYTPETGCILTPNNM